MGKDLILSIVISDRDTNLERTINRELKGVDIELLNSGWAEGTEFAEGRFICFLEAGAMIEPGFFYKNLFIYLSQPTFLKLAMVASAVNTVSTPDSNYGFRFNDGIEALLKPDSSMTHNVQVGFIGGSIVRRSALDHVQTDWDGDPLQISTDVSLKLWENGLRVQLNPNSTYTSPSRKEATPNNFNVSEEVKKIWHREAIGELA